MIGNKARLLSLNTPKLKRYQKEVKSEHENDRGYNDVKKCTLSVRKLADMLPKPSVENGLNENSSINEIESIVKPLDLSVWSENIETPGQDIRQTLEISNVTHFDTISISSEESLNLITPKSKRFQKKIESGNQETNSSRRERENVIERENVMAYNIKKCFVYVWKLEDMLSEPNTIKKDLNENSFINESESNFKPLNISLGKENIETTMADIQEKRGIYNMTQIDIISISSEESLKNSSDKPVKIIKKKASTEIKRKTKKVKNVAGYFKTETKKRKAKTKKMKFSDSDDDYIDETEKPTIIRKLTKSTNLKTFAYEYHPPSQTRIENYFNKTPKTGIGYFETFEKSKLNEPKTSDSTIQNVNAYIDVLLEEAEMMDFSNEIRTNSGEMEKIQIKVEKDSVLNIENYIQDAATSQIVNKRIITKRKITFDTESLEHQAQSNKSSYSCSLSETAQIYKPSSFRKSSESNSTIESKGMKAPICKKARKRLSFKASNSKNQISPVFSELESKDSFNPLNNLSVPEKSLETASYNMNIEIKEGSCKENFLPEFDKIIELSDDDSDKILMQKNVDCTTLKKDVISKSKKLNKKRKIVECPSYKVVNGTTFAVDAFRFGYIEGITHYFLSHYHCDHYIGLKKTFSMPLYMSSITARLVESFIHVRSEYVNVIDPNESVIVNGIEVTAIDANHCPGALMFAFKFPNGAITLHTGDFRASFEMESNPYFWNNKIDTIYLDTTYLNNNYDFKSQSESIEDVRECIEKFLEKHIEKKILYVCGSYVIGKEKVWKAMAEVTGQLVYTTGNRLKALKSICDPELIKHIAYDPKIAGIHVLSLGELFYDKLFEYFKLYEEDFDILLAIRPSGWERKSKPQYRGKINIVGVEYSEHSSYSELRRFIRFLQPRNIISTVSNGSDLSKTCPIPIHWFDNQIKPKQIPFQTSITNFGNSRKKSNRKNNTKHEAICTNVADDNSSRYETFVSPIKTETINSGQSNQIS